MATPSLGTFLRQLKRNMSAESLAGCSDVEIVERFRLSRDDAVFQVILDRHGPMVFQVCRRALSSQADIEDAFQATFLTLIRRGHTIRRHASLGSWLHGVAHRTALKLRTQSARRKRREKRSAVNGSAVVSEDLTWQELRGILDEELRRLPESSRAPLVLCYLEGRTQDEAAVRLKLSKSTIRRQLDRGRELLGRRLAKRGVALGSVLAARLISESIHGAELPRSLLIRTAESIAHNAAVSPHITVLSDGVIKTMYYAKCKSVAGMLACCLALAIGVYQVSPRLASAQDAKPPAKAASPAPDIEPIDPNLVFDPAVQKQLRLSENQIHQLHDARDKGTAAASDQNRRVGEYDERIKKLEEEIAKLRAERDLAANAVQKSQSDQVKGAIPKVLSRDGVQQLRQITLQNMRLSDVLLDARIRERLELNDEQVKKIQELTEKSKTWAILRDGSVSVGYDVGLHYSAWTNTLLPQQHRFATWAYFGIENDTSRSDLLKVLTPKQKEALERLSGAKYEKSK
jgi:RNA polymerase sigma factor (sigma-70 family)